MGLMKKPSSSTFERPTPAQTPPAPPLPDPSRYDIRYAKQIGASLVVEVIYHDCTTFEGRKILLFACTTLRQLQQQNVIDPHFSNTTRYRSPIARFEPTPMGLALCEQTAMALEAMIRKGV